MDGFTVAQTIRNDGDLTGVTVMMLTSERGSGDIARAKSLGLSAYLMKPIKRGELLSVIRSAKGRPQIEPDAQAPLEQTEGEQRPVRILLVDDSEDNRLLIQAYLKTLPHTLDMAENGEMAVSKFQNGIYDVVLMDMQMPVMDGYTATRTIRAWEQERQRPATPLWPSPLMP